MLSSIKLKGQIYNIPISLVDVGLTPAMSSARKEKKQGVLPWASGGGGGGSGGGGGGKRPSSLSSSKHAKKEMPLLSPALRGISGGLG